MNSAPIIDTPKEIKNIERKIEISSNKNNLYEIKLINEVSYLLIQASFNNPLQTLQYENIFPLETIKKILFLVISNQSMKFWKNYFLL